MFSVVSNRAGLRRGFSPCTLEAGNRDHQGTLAQVKEAWPGGGPPLVGLGENWRGGEGRVLLEGELCERARGFLASLVIAKGRLACWLRKPVRITGAGLVTALLCLAVGRPSSRPLFRGAAGWSLPQTLVLKFGSHAILQRTASHLGKQKLGLLL